MARCQELAFIKRAIKRDGKRETVRISVCVPVFLTEGETDLFLSFSLSFFIVSCIIRHTHTFTAIGKHFIYTLGKTTTIVS